MTTSTVLLDVQGHVAVLTLNRPQALNALNTEMMDALSAALDRCEEDPDIGCMIITGAGKAFAAGADFLEMADKSFSDAYLEDFVTRNWERVTRCRKPVIAAVNGIAYGGGCELALMCDFILCAQTARFAQPEVNFGVIPGAGGTQRLARSIGKSKAMEMCLTGTPMMAIDAERCGLVSRVLPACELLPEALRVAARISECSRPAVLMAKESVNRAFEVSLSEGVRFERRMAHASFALEDQREGAKAFTEKRKPVFKHR